MDKKPHPEYDNYLISESGHVYRKGRKLSAWQSKKGYLRVCLSISGKTISRPVHRLVAQTYIPNPENKPEVNHKDTNKTNNSVSNLEWATNEENVEHAIKSGLYNRNLKKEDILKIRELSKSLTNKRLCEIFGVTSGCISKIVGLKSWKRI